MKVALDEKQLVQKANEELQLFAGYQDGMKVYSARMDKHLLVMDGDCFLDENGGPTSKTPEAIKAYNEFAREFAKKYTLIS